MRLFNGTMRSTKAYPAAFSLQISRTCSNGWGKCRAPVNALKLLWTVSLVECSTCRLVPKDLTAGLSM